MAPNTSSSSPDRRKFLETAARGVAGAAAVGALLATQARQGQALPTHALRPPGALADERAFQAACVRCGLCVRDCPYDTLKLASFASTDAATGTPFFTARSVPCEMCDDIPCVKACPTGALDHALVDIAKARMGTAVLVDEENCLNFLGLRCDVCYRVCPVIDEAITLEVVPNTRTKKHAVFKPTVHADQCTGCGKCEKACVLEQAAIKVLPIATARGSAGKHYRLGWEEFQKNQGPLVDGVIDLPDRAPDAVPPPAPSNLPEPAPFQPLNLKEGFKP
jgi:ferredoxin-type protein NapG